MAEHPDHHLHLDGPARRPSAGPPTPRRPPAHLGPPVTITVDASSSSVCSISGGVGELPGRRHLRPRRQPGRQHQLHAAPQVQQTFTVGKGSPDDHLHLDRADAPASAGPPTPRRPPAASGNPVTFTVGLGHGLHVWGHQRLGLHLRRRGTCIVDANQAGNANYNAAPQVQQTFGRASAARPSPSPRPRPASARSRSHLHPAATGHLGQPGDLLASTPRAPAAALSGRRRHLHRPPAPASLDANQAGNASYRRGAPGPADLHRRQGHPDDHLHLDRPDRAAVVGGTYTATATGGASGNPVTFTIDARAHGGLHA